jgi:hypothetical protein
MPKSPPPVSENTVDAIKGLVLGAILGGFAGLGICIWLIAETLLFPGDTMVAGALICGFCGYRWGDDFFDWLSDNWHHFT